MGSIFKRVILMACLILFMGCGATVPQYAILKKYPEYADYIKRNTKYYCMINAAIFRSREVGKEGSLSIEANSTYATGLLDTCIKELQLKHYAISDKHITSVDAKNVISGRVPNPNDLPTFYAAVDKYKKADRNLITSIKNLDPENGRSTAVVVSVTGGGGPYSFTQSLLSGTTGRYLVAIKLLIINSSTGEVVWDDLERIDSNAYAVFSLTQEIFKSGLEKIIKRLPDRQT